MHYLIESILVGCYSLSIYYLLYFIKLRFLPMLVLIGFLKHFIGYFLLHDSYCKYGYACKGLYTGLKTQHILYIFFESIIEGIFFLLFGLILKYFIKSNIFIIFLIGFLLHIFGEWSGLHSHFCKRCIQIRT